MSNYITITNILLTFKFQYTMNQSFNIEITEITNFSLLYNTILLSHTYSYKIFVMFVILVLLYLLSTSYIFYVRNCYVITFKKYVINQQCL